jgi:hypothetical protein
LSNYHISEPNRHDNGVQSIADIASALFMSTLSDQTIFKTKAKLYRDPKRDLHHLLPISFLCVRKRKQLERLHHQLRSLLDDG